MKFEGIDLGHSVWCGRLGGRLQRRERIHCAHEIIDIPQYTDHQCLHWVAIHTHTHITMLPA